MNDTRHPPCILFVDDNRGIREFWKSQLEQDGYSVIVASDGYEALDLTSERTVDLAVLDVCMPRMSGPELANRLRACDQSLPLIYYTTHREDLGVSGGSVHGPCILKSEDPGELRQAVEAVLSRQP